MQAARVYEQPLPRVLTMNDVAQYLRISRSAAYELAQHPEFPILRLGRTIRVTQESFLMWLQDAAVQTKKK